MEAQERVGPASATVERGLLVEPKGHHVTGRPAPESWPTTRSVLQSFENDTFALGHVTGAFGCSPNFRDEKSYIGGTTPLPNNTAPLSSVPSACFSVGTKTIAPGVISLCSAGTNPTIGIFAGMMIFCSPPL
jgi:hypothetical protein